MKLTFAWIFIKAIIHFIYVSCTPFLKHTYKLSFIKESNGCWYIDFSNWPKNYHENLMMVAGADKLCDEFDDGTGHAYVKVVTSNSRVNWLNFNYIECIREWADLEYGGQYYIPVICRNAKLTKVISMWLCQVTLFVLGWWPKYIYLFKNE